MGDKSGIEWTDATWNPVSGCSKVSQGCKFCYAERVFPRPYPGRKFTDVKMHENRLDQPLRWKRPRKIFVNSMSDLFHESVTDEFIGRIFLEMEDNERHTFQILTKRPQRMLDWFRLSPQTNYEPAKNIWIGVSVEDQATADERIPLLLQTPAAIRFVSYEPALGPACFERIPCREHWYDGSNKPLFYYPLKNGINWVIAGGESGPNARPSHPDWFRSVRDQCQAAGVPFFMKQITERGRKIPYDSFPSDLMVREYPNAVA